MFWVRAKYRERDGARPYLEAACLIFQCPSRAEGSDGVESSHLVVTWIAGVQIGHDVHVCNPTFVVRADFSPQSLDCVQETTFPIRWSLGKSRVTCWTQSREHRTRIVFVGRRFAKERVVVTERLAPVRKNEIWVKHLCRLKLLDRLLPSKTVKDSDASQKVVLCL
jgi:hypothetical protein